MAKIKVKIIEIFSSFSKNKINADIIKDEKIDFDIKFQSILNLNSLLL